MSVQKNEIYDLLKRLEIILEKSFSILPNYLVAVKLKEIEQIIDSIYGALPKEVQEARRLLRRKEELQIDAEQKANKIINDANTEAARLLSESELLRKVQSEAELIKEQVIAECEEIKRKALEDAENFRNQAHDDAIRIKEGAEAYVFTTDFSSWQKRDIGSTFEKLSTNAPSKPENGTVTFANGELQINWGASKGDIWHYNVHMVKEGEKVSYLNMLGETFTTSYSFAPQFKGVYYLIIQPESNQGVYGQALKLKVELN